MRAVHLSEGSRIWRPRVAIRHGAVAALRGLVPALWRGRSLRWQVLATFVLINAIAGLVTASIVIFNAKRATEAEIGSAIAVAERFVRASIDNLDRMVPGGVLLEDLPPHIGPMRHVRIVISTASGRPVWLARPTHDTAHSYESAAPRWFASLVQVENLSRDIPVIAAGKRLGTVSVSGEPQDEIAEVWSDISDLAVVGALVDLSVILVLYFAFGRVLTPLSALSDGMWELEQGHFRHRLAGAKARELADLSRRFNILAGSLGVARDENVRLHRRLVTAADDERRFIANELHDELGPCLFGLRANIASLDRMAADVPAERAAHVRERVRILADIAGHLQTVNRRLLNRLRPIALGDIPLADILGALVAEFRKHEGAADIACGFAQLGQSYGDCVDLTLYRCMQESLTNIVRHSQATSVNIQIEEVSSLPPDGGAALRLVLSDNGCGIGNAPLGMGLSGMKERVQALGGGFSLSTPAVGGTRLEIVLPTERAEGRQCGAVIKRGAN